MNAAGLRFADEKDKLEGEIAKLRSSAERDESCEGGTTLYAGIHNEWTTTPERQMVILASHRIAAPIGRCQCRKDEDELS